MAPEVSGVEDPFPGSFDQQHVGIKSGMVRKDRSHGKRPNGEWSRAAIPCFEGPGNRMTCDVADDGDQLRGVGSSPDWPGSGKFVDQTPVVLVRMANKNGGGAAIFLYQ